MAAIVICSIAIAAGCDTHITDEVAVKNDSGEALHFEVTLADGSNFALPVEAPPGQTASVLNGSQLNDRAGVTKDRCTVGELRALGPDGRVVKRWRPPVCATTTLTVP